MVKFDYKNQWILSIIDRMISCDLFIYIFVVLMKMNVPVLY